MPFVVIDFANIIWNFYIEEIHFKVMEVASKWPQVGKLLEELLRIGSDTN